MLKTIPFAEEVGRDTARSDCSGVSTEVDAVEGSEDIFGLSFRQRGHVYRPMKLNKISRQ